MSPTLFSNCNCFDQHLFLFLQAKRFQSLQAVTADLLLRVFWVHLVISATEWPMCVKFLKRKDQCNSKQQTMFLYCLHYDFKEISFSIDLPFMKFPRVFSEGCCGSSCTNSSTNWLETSLVSMSHDQEIW